MPRRMQARIPRRSELRSNWPDFTEVRGVNITHVEANADKKSDATKWLILALGVLILIGVTARKPITSGAKMLVDKLKIKELLQKYGSLTFLQAPAEAKPAALAKIYPLITNPETKARLDTIPLNRLWGIEGFFSFNPDTAMVNSVRKIASTPQEFVSMLKQPAINIAKKYGMSDPMIIVAQAAHEGGWGKSAIGGTNIFGHVATPKWTGRYSFENTWESKDGKSEKTIRPFRVYDSLDHALDSHMKVIVAKWPTAVKAKDAGSYADTLQGGKTKYATDPDYKKKLQDVYATVKKYW